MLPPITLFVNNNNKEISEKQKRQREKFGSSVIALTANSIISDKIPALFTSKFHQGILKTAAVSGKEEEIAKEGAKKVFEEIAKLPEKGVKFNNVKNVANVACNNVNETGTKALLKQIADGKNAFYISNIPNRFKSAFQKFGLEQNSININMEKMPLASFHEMGHAFNYNNSAFWKTMQNMSKTSRIAAGIFAIIPAITSEQKAQEGKELTKTQKFINVLRKASPILTGVSLLPTLLEEGKASLRANKWAKEVFKETPSLAKRVAKTNKIAYCTYLISAIALTAGAFATKKIKDTLDSPTFEGVKSLKEKVETKYCHQA